MTPEARLLLVHACAFALVRPRLDDERHRARAVRARALAAERAQWPEGPRRVAEAIVALHDAYAARDGSLHMRAVLTLEGVVRHYFDTLVACDMARERRT